jgi:DMSO reductase anchor subunit
MSDTVTVSTPNPAPAQLVLAVLRAVLLVAGVLGLTLPAALNDQSTLAALAGAVSTLVGIGWQVIAEFQHADTTHAAAVASAQAGAPVKPV